MKRILSYLTAITLAFTLIGGLYAYDQRKANASDVVLVQEQIRLLHKEFSASQKIMRARDIDNRIWTLENRYEGKTIPLSVKEEIHRLKMELRVLRME